MQTQQRNIKQAGELSQSQIGRQRSLNEHQTTVARVLPPLRLKEHKDNAGDVGKTGCGQVTRAKDLPKLQAKFGRAWI